jgi:hypothetical protein
VLSKLDMQRANDKKIVIVSCQRRTDPDPRRPFARLLILLFIATAVAFVLLQIWIVTA